MNRQFSSEDLQNGQQVYEKIYNIIIHHRNVMESHNEILSSCWDGYY
jgi:hypothetical protein